MDKVTRIQLTTIVERSFLWVFIDTPSNSLRESVKVTLQANGFRATKVKRNTATRQAMYLSLAGIPKKMLKESMAEAQANVKAIAARFGNCKVTHSRAKLENFAPKKKEPKTKVTKTKTTPDPDASEALRNAMPILREATPLQSIDVEAITRAVVAALQATS